MTSRTAITAPKPQLIAGGKVRAIIPQDAEQAFRMAEAICGAGMAPQSLDSPQKVVTAIFAGLEIGLSPFQAVQSMAMVNNRPCLWGDALPALCYGSGLVEDFNESFLGSGDKLEAVCRVQRKGIASPYERRFSVDDAKKAGLWSKKGTWQQYPKRMLQVRARSWALRDAFPDVLKGIGVAEEQQDIAYAESFAPAAADAPPQVTASALIEQAAEPSLNETAPQPSEATQRAATPAAAPYILQTGADQFVEAENAEGFVANFIKSIELAKTPGNLDGLWHAPQNQETLARLNSEGKEDMAKSVQMAVDTKDAEIGKESGTLV